MKWKKGGLIYAPSGSLWWAKSYALIPTAEVLENSVRIYYSSVDENMFGRIGSLELDINNLNRIIRMDNEPLLDLGSLGTFDDSGVNASCVINFNGKKYLYYIGWQRAERVPYMLFSGLAISTDGGKTFTKHSQVPVLDRTDTEPFIRSATTIIEDDGKLKMWYVSAYKWEALQGKLFKGELYPNYIIKHAESTDGINWTSFDKICINIESPDEFGFGRPWVIKEDGVYKMWYSIRSRDIPYRLGYAESTDGLNWQRKDNEVGITASDDGWDSKMICYPCVVDVNGRRVMFYNGNRHGESGFGYAVLEK